MLLRVLALLLSTTSVCLALDCNALAPVKPQDMTQELKGKIDGKIGGLFAKIASANASVDGSYREVSRYVLTDLPNASVVYMWERVLYLQCQAIAEAKDMSSKDKVKTIGDLYQKFGSPPPTLDGAKTIVNTGNNNTIIQGNDNSAKKGD
jgi:hypothetical protein